MLRRPLLLLAALAALAAPARAQYFGQNHVQFERFQWRILKTEHFDVHYYQDLGEMARLVAQMAERSYGRLSKLMGWEFRERKPIVLFASRGDFAQNNVFGDLGEGTGGVTDALRQRNMFFVGSDMAEAEHVLTHEMVHVFQYDIFGSGRAGGGLERLAQNGPPLWFIEGMAEYLSIGPDHPVSDAIIRDAALNGNLPDMQRLTQRPDLYFPYRYGEMVWRYVGERWGDEVIGEIMQAAASTGPDRAFKRYTGLSMDELGDEWKETMQQRYLPGVAQLERPRKFAQPLLNARRTGGIIPVYVAPALSSDGRYIAYISTGSLLRAEVFLDLYLADALTGKRIKRLTKSTLNPEFEELRYGYSQAAFSPDGRQLAFTAQRQGKDVLYILDVRTRGVVRRLDTPLKSMIGPSWSPDGRRLVFSGNAGGFTDLYMIDADGKNLRRLTDDVYGDLMPQFSPDGRRVAFVSERGPQSDAERLRFGKWRISVLDLEGGAVEVLPGQGGKNLNPQWAPDGRSVAFVSDRTGIAQVFLYDFGTREHYQLTRLVGGVQSVTENSPALTWARQADKLAFTYFDNGDYTIWSVANPRALRKEPYREPVTVAAGTGAGTPTAQPTAQPTAADSAALARADAAGRIADLAGRIARNDSGAAPGTPGAPATGIPSTDPRRTSVYRGAGAPPRGAGVLPAPGTPGAPSPVSVAALRADAAQTLPDPGTFTDIRYDARLRPEAVIQPQIGYAQGNFGQGVYGASGILLSDLLGNRRLTIAGGVNGRIEDAQLFVNYTSMARRFNYMTGVQQTPIFFFNGSSIQDAGGGRAVQSQVIARFVQRNAYFSSLYPRNRFTRFEAGASFNNLDRQLLYISRGLDLNFGFASGFYIDSIVGLGSLNYMTPYVAYVHDNAIMGSTGGIYGKRYRLAVEANTGRQGWMTYSTDLRRYDALIFSFLTLATRLQADVSVGPGERIFPKFIARPDLMRGYDREAYNGTCGANPDNANQCPANALIGSRVAFANAELRVPLVRRFDLGLLPVSLPPIDGLVFYDAGIAWSQGQRVSLGRPANYDFQTQRYALRSWGFGLRLNLFNAAIIRWDYSRPLDGSNRKGYWFWTFGPSF